MHIFFLCAIAQAAFGDIQQGTTNHKVSNTSSKFVYFLSHFQNLESSNTTLLIFGNGDRGGGPRIPVASELQRMFSIWVPV